MSEGNYEINDINPKDMGYVNIQLLKNDDVEIRNYVIDNTIMQAPLVRMLLPGDSTNFYIDFKSQIPADGGRTAHNATRFDVGQWFPKPALYDRHGWHANQYLENSEFFADFGSWDVEITLPAKYIIAHSGYLLNEKEVFGGDLPIPQGDSIIVDALKSIIKDTALLAPAAVSNTDSEGVSANAVGPIQDLKTWKIKADSIHDFSFCADPDFLLDICQYHNTIIKVYYTKKDKDKWQRNGADYTRKAIKLYSELYFPYPFGQFSTVASIVSGGMEYPQLVMVNDKIGSRNKYDHDLESTIAHEVGHNWYQGILAFNETEQAFLDEGLTSFATVIYLEHYYGRRHNNFAYPRLWQKKYLPNGDERNDEQRIYISRALQNDEDPMNMPANLFKDGGRYYNASYEKAVSVYFMLQYAMGEKNFDRMIKLLWERWAFRHPYLSDLEEIAEEVSDTDLRWFFKQWFTTTWKLDYAIDHFSEKREIAKDSAGYRAAVTIKNNQRCISPLDLAFYFSDGSIDTAFIPVNKWTDGQKDFDTTLYFISAPRKVAINPDLRLADVDRLNNSSGWPKMHWQFMVPAIIYPNNYVENYVESYTIAHNPMAWYNSIDGVKIGYRFKGSYLDITQNFILEAAIGLQNGKVDYNLRYENKWFSFSPDLSYYIGSRELEGRGRQEVGLHYGADDSNAPDALQANLSLRRYYLFNDHYLFGGGWSPGNVNTIDLNAGKKISQRFFYVVLQGSISAAAPGSDFNFTRVAGAIGLFTSGIGSGETRLFLKAGKADGEVPSQRLFYLSSADPLETWESPLYSSRGTLPDQQKNEGHLFKPGGAGLSGYLGRGLTGSRMLSAKISNDLPRIRLPIDIPFINQQLRSISPEAYLAGGYVWFPHQSSSVDKFLYEGGLVFEYRIPYLDLLIQESRLSLFLPLWLSNPSKGEHNFRWRWLIGFSS
jgi:hypothetical protein